MEAWKTLVNTALLGTEKRGAPADLAANATGVQTGTPPDAEAAFLRDAAILSAYRRGGAEPLKFEVRSTVAEAETRPYAGPAATSVLSEILSAGNNGLLRLWLRLAQQRGQLIPLQYLDTILDLAQKNSGLRPDLRAAAGSRGAWLAGLNPQWSFLMPAAGADDPWETGTAVERSAFLQRLRYEDPAKARAMLEAVWAKEGAEGRERLLGTFATGLGPEDLGFLEHALTDKSKRVAAQATELLMKVPGSSIVQGFEAWLREAVQIQTTTKLLGMLSKTAVTISSPELEDKKLLDAIGKTPSGVSESIFRLQQMSSHVPPAFWETHLNQRREKVLELLTEAAPEVFPGALADAAATFGDRKWAMLIAESGNIFYSPVIDLLEKPVQERYLKKFAASHPETILNYYGQNEEDWLPELAAGLLPHIASQPYQYGKPFLNGHAWRMPLGILPTLESIAPAPTNAQDYMRQYAIQSWPANRQALRDALELKGRLVNAFVH
jgi:hypothetical protein